MPLVGQMGYRTYETGRVGLSVWAVGYRISVLYQLHFERPMRPRERDNSTPMVGVAIHSETLRTKELIKLCCTG